MRQYYLTHDEEDRLLTQHGQVEFLTTMKYIKKYLKKDMRVLEVGAATGRYSLALAHEGHQVDAIELMQNNLDRLKQGIAPTDRITAIQGNALDLSVYGDETFDMVLILGPMYHLYKEADKQTAMREAVRVAKKNGLIFVAYCMNEAAVLQTCFQNKKLIRHCLENHMLTADYHCISKPEDLFEMVRLEDINRLNSAFPIERLVLLASDGAANYIKDTVDAMDEYTFQIYLDYHFATCERQDLIGATNHSLDILRKK